MARKRLQRWGSYEDKRDWREYNEKLVKRGEMYLSLDFLESWARDLNRMNKGKVGAPYQYTQALMTFLGFIHIMLRIDYRGLEGFMRGLAKLVPGVKVPDYSTICRRVSSLRVEILDTLLGHEGKDVVISLDASGIKVTNRGEWIREKWKVRRGWIKVHIAVDKEKKQCIAIEVTDENVGDNKKFGPLVKKAEQNIVAKGGRLKQVNADGIYDTRENFNALDELEVIPTIKIRENASALARGCPLRRKHVLEYKKIGYKAWKDKYEYGYRWRPETNLSAVKRLTGEYVSATKKENIFQEVERKFLFYNAILKFDSMGEVLWG